jgi:hypothetical protein
MEDQAKILIGVFSGFIGIGVMIGLSILGWRKINNKIQKIKKNKRIETGNVLKEIVIQEMQKKILQIGGDLNEMSLTVNELKNASDEEKRLKKEREEEATRLHIEALVKKLNEIMDPQIAVMHKKLDVVEKRHKDTRAALEAYEKLVTQGVKDLQGAGEGFKVLRRMKKEDKEIENETDPDVRDAMIAQQAETLKALRENLINDNVVSGNYLDDDGVNDGLDGSLPGCVLIPNTPD